MVSNIIGSWSALARNDSSCCLSIWEEIILRKCSENEHGRKTKISASKSCNRCKNVSAQNSVFLCTIPTQWCSSTCEITDYVFKIEFQMRGSPHAHCLLWVKDAPKIDQDPNEVVIDFIDKYITATLPNHDHAYEKDRKIMENLQKHTHSDYCRRNNTCWFGFPKPPSTETLISRPPPNDDTDTTKKAKEILQKVKDFLTTTDVEDMSLQDILLQLELSQQTYNTVLQTSHWGPNVILKWNPQDVFLKACNQDILYL